MATIQKPLVQLLRNLSRFVTHRDEISFQPSVDRLHGAKGYLMEIRDVEELATVQKPLVQNLWQPFVIRNTSRPNSVSSQVSIGLHGANGYHVEIT
ncbi:hypothetical protein AVEN_170357-1 [Araneus ventricosus]|uniref:Uncharacterized protein n=1 Tax=Araneus ventricosus TaxID=182803 RepID=A0A4Y2CAL7_ARAVE|nr:hypothetical protein AVEN_170357-1 [Araneus ventricosus]